MNRATLRSVAKVITKGTTPSSVGGAFTETGINFIKSESIAGSKYPVTDFYAYIDSETDEKLKRSRLAEGDLLVSIAGAYLGKLAIVTERDVPANTNQAVGIVRLDRSIVDENYIYYYFSQPHITAYINNLSAQSSQPNLNLDLLGKLEFDQRNLAEQKRIASVLSALDAKIELNNAINAELEGMAKLLYDYWFVQFDFPLTAAQAASLGRPELAGHPYKSSGGPMVQNPTLNRPIPEGWSALPLGDCIERIIDHRGKTPIKLGGDWSSRPDAIIALSAKIVKRGKLIGVEKANRVDEELYQKWMPHKLEEGDVLMTSEAPAGECYFILGKTDYCLSQRLFAIRSNRSIVQPTYLYQQLLAGHAHSEILGSLSGSTVFGIRQDVLRTIRILVPEIETQQLYEQTIMPQLKQIRTLEQQNQELTALRDWLLPMLMNGQVTVGS